MSRRALILTKTAVWLLCLAPLGRLLLRGYNSFHGLEPDLTANPLEFITLSTGTWTFVFLLATLSVTPLRRVTGWNAAIRFRRLLGLFAFFYGCLHFLTYLWFDREFEFSGVPADIAKRPFITAGFLAWLMLAPLAVTSTAWAIRKLGGRNWNRLHWLIYPAGIAAAVHFFWKVKSDYTEPGTYAAVLAVLLLFRLGWWLRTRAKPAPGQKQAD